MVTKAKPTKDELWVEKTCGTDLSKLDATFQEGGKLRKKFLSDLEEFRAFFEANEKMMQQQAKEKLDPDAQKRLAFGIKTHKAAMAQAKKADLKGALQSEMAAREEMSKRGVTSDDASSGKLGQRMAGTTVR